MKDECQKFELLSNNGRADQIVLIKLARGHLVDYSAPVHIHCLVTWNQTTQGTVFELMECLLMIKVQAGFYTPNLVSRNRKDKNNKH